MTRRLKTVLSVLLSVGCLWTVGMVMTQPETPQCVTTYCVHEQEF